MALAENPALRTDRDFLLEYNLTQEQVSRLLELIAREPLPEAPPGPPLDITRGLSDEELLRLAQRGIIV